METLTLGALVLLSGILILRFSGRLLRNITLTFLGLFLLVVGLSYFLGLVNVSGSIVEAGVRELKIKLFDIWQEIRLYF